MIYCNVMVVEATGMSVMTVAIGGIVINGAYIW